MAAGDSAHGGGDETGDCGGSTAVFFTDLVADPSRTVVFATGGAMPAPLLPLAQDDAVFFSSSLSLFIMMISFFL